MSSGLGLRTLRSIARPSRQLLTRAARRKASTTPPNLKDPNVKLEGVYDNAFNRERIAVKKHAQATAVFWRKLSLYVVVPALIITGANTWVQWNAHWEHQAHEPPITERTQYPYMNLRIKAYPWGDGDKTLFWNDNYNYHKKTED